MKKKLFKVFTCIFLFTFSFLILIVPCFANSYFWADGAVNLSVPITYGFRGGPDFSYLGYYTVSTVTNNSTQTGKSDNSIGLGTSTVRVTSTYSTTGNRVYGRTTFAPDEFNPDISRFTGFSLGQPFIVQSSESIDGYVRLYGNSREDVTTRIFGYYEFTLYNFETKVFDSFNYIFEDLTDITDIGIVPATFSDYLTPHYLFDNLAIIGELTFSYFTLTDDNASAYDPENRFPAARYFKGIDAEVSLTYPSLQNRNDEYLSKILSTQTPIEYVDIGDTDWTDWLTSSVASFLNAPLFGTPYLTFSNLLFIVISVAVFLIFLKIFAGG